MMQLLGNLFLSFLSHEWAGLVLALLLGLAGYGVVHMARAHGIRWVKGIGYLVVGIAGIAALGATYHVIYMSRILAANPAPGKMVDVGGYRMHVLAEGEPNGKPAVVWMPGAHSAGFAMYHLHAILRQESRSILVDRPGSGWSDPGPFPRTTAVEAEEIVTALKNAGEKGPFVLAGHSMGGLLVANIARRHPELIAGLVMLDGTPPDAINYAPPNPYVTQMQRDAVLAALTRLFGIHPALAQRLWGKEETDPAFKELDRIIRSRLGPAMTTMETLENGAKSSVAGASIFAELLPGGMGYETVVFDGDLGDLPLFLAAPRDLVEFAAVSKAIAAQSGKADPAMADTARMLRFYTRTRERYMATSSRSERLYAPAGTGHNFVYETPEFAAEAVRRMQREHPLDASAAAPASAPPTEVQ